MTFEREQLREFEGVLPFEWVDEILNNQNEIRELKEQIVKNNTFGLIQNKELSIAQDKLAKIQELYPLQTKLINSLRCRLNEIEKSELSRLELDEILTSVKRQQEKLKEILNG